MSQYVPKHLNGCSWLPWLKLQKPSCFSRCFFLFPEQPCPLSIFRITPCKPSTYFLLPGENPQINIIDDYLPMIFVMMLSTPLMINWMLTHRIKNPIIRSIIFTPVISKNFVTVNDVRRSSQELKVTTVIASKMAI